MVFWNLSVIISVYLCKANHSFAQINWRLASISPLSPWGSAYPGFETSFDIREAGETSTPAQQTLPAFPHCFQSFSPSMNELTLAEPGVAMNMDLMLIFNLTWRQVTAIINGNEKWSKVQLDANWAQVFCCIGTGTGGAGTMRGGEAHATATAASSPRRLILKISCCFRGQLRIIVCKPSPNFHMLGN